MSTSPSIHDRDSYPHARRNLALGVTAGAIGGVGNAFTHPELILAGLICTLARSPHQAAVLVAILAFISRIGMTTPQIFAGNLVEHRSRKMPSYVVTVFLQGAGYSIIAASIWLMKGTGSVPLYALFFGGFLLVSAAGGIGYAVSMDLIGNMIPASRAGTYFGSRGLAGNLLAAVAGMVAVQRILVSFPAPQNYLILVVVGATLGLIGGLVFTCSHEQPHPSAPPPTTIKETLRRGMGWLRSDRNYRTLLGIRCCLRVNYLSLAFFVPYGIQRLGGGDTRTTVLLGGIMVAAMRISQVVSGAAWGALADRRGYRSCFVASGALFAIAPALALLAPALPHVYALTTPASAVRIDLPLTVYLLSLAAIAAALQGNSMGDNKFSIVNAPDGRRISYVGFISSITSPLNLLPLVAAALVGLIGISSIFAITAAFGVLTTLLALRMQPRKSPASNHAEVNHQPSLDTTPLR